MPRPTRSTAFQARVKKLRAELPPAYPVTVRRGRVDPGNVAEASLSRVGGRKRFVIVIRREADFAEATDSLIHEWAHCLAWSDGHPVLTAHDEMWGVAFSRAYRCLFPDEAAR